MKRLAIVFALAALTLSGAVAAKGVLNNPNVTDACKDQLELIGAHSVGGAVQYARGAGWGNPAEAVAAQFDSVGDAIQSCKN
jgi:hypothetical protein